jgi:opacity protein-like surface antigen
MKTICITATLLLAVVFSFAQQNRITFGVEGGISIANLSSNDTYYKDIYESRTGYAAGIALQYNFPKIISLRTGVMYELTGASSDIIFTDNQGNPTEAIKTLDNIDYLVVPLLLRATFGDKINFFVNAGPYWATLLKRRLVLEKAIVLPNGDTVDEYDTTDDTKKTDFGISAGIGAAAVFNERIAISLEVRDNLGMTDIAPQTYELKTRTILILAGVAFKFGSRENDSK